jgi:hypothetical protein
MVTTTAALDQWPLTLTVEESATASVRLRPQCALFFGGDWPIHYYYSTLYRGIAVGRYPKPVHVGPNIPR